MAAKDRIGIGDLRESLVALQDKVRRDPADPKQRVFLFQLLAVEGQWERASTQLEACAQLDPTLESMAEIYRVALRAEATRRAVFQATTTPTVFGEPQGWEAELVEAMRLSIHDRKDEATELRLRAYDRAPAVEGVIDGTDFLWFSDADNRLGPVLEAILNGQYLWIPFDRIKAIRIQPPTDLRDLVWLPAAFTWTNGGEASGMIPSRYPDSENQADSDIRLGRRTDWSPIGEDHYAGLGQRMFATDSGEYPLLDVRHIEFKSGHG